MSNRSDGTRPKILVLVTHVNHEDPISRECWERLDSAEQQCSAEIANTAERKRFVIGRSLLRRAVAAFTQSNERFSIYLNQDGKPQVGDGFKNIEFSISHSENAIAVGVSSAGRVGIDLERIAPLDPKLIDIVFSAAEASAMNALPEAEKSLAWVELWTAKEAIAKLLGCPPQLDVRSLPRSFQDRGTLKSWILNWGAEAAHLCLAHESREEPEIFLSRESA